MAASAARRPTAPPDGKGQATSQASLLTETEDTPASAVPRNRRSETVGRCGDNGLAWFKQFVDQLVMWSTEVEHERKRDYGRLPWLDCRLPNAGRSTRAWVEYGRMQDHAMSDAPTASTAPGKGHCVAA